MEPLLNIQPNQQNLSLHHLPTIQSSGMPLIDTVFMILNEATSRMNYHDFQEDIYKQCKEK